MDVELAVDSPAVTGDVGYESDVALMNGTAWEGVLVVEGVETGDGREFSPNALTWAETPLPLRRNIEDSHGGMPMTKAVLVGRIDEIYRNPDNPLEIRGRGVFDDEGTHGAEALRLVRGQFLKGISIDSDDIKDADIELVFPEGDDADEDAGGDILDALIMMPDKTIFHAGRLRAATLCDIPAFVEAQVWLPENAPAAVLAAGQTHFGALSDRSWNGPAHERRLAPQMTMRLARQAYAHVTTGSKEVTKTAVRFLHHEVADDGTVNDANLTACSVGLRTINAGRATALTLTERRTAYGHMAEHLRSAGLVPPPFEDDEVITAGGAFEHLARPPREWFEDPKLTAVTPITVTDDGHVYGHGAEWGSCHTGFADICRKPPREGEHSYFRLGEVACDDGSRVAVGTLTLGTGHAPTIRGVTASQAAEHYDNTGTVVAIVASGEDQYGIWVAGAIRPGTSEARVQELRAAPLSGDWRRIGGKLRLVAFLAVNRPGFPVPRTRTFVSKQQQLSLVAAGVVTQDMRHVGRGDVGAELALARIARSIGRDPQSRLAALRRRVRGE